MRTRLFERLLMRRVVRRHPLIAGSQTTRRGYRACVRSCQRRGRIAMGVAGPARDRRPRGPRAPRDPRPRTPSTSAPSNRARTFSRRFARWPRSARNGSTVRLVFVGGQRLDRQASRGGAGVRPDGTACSSGPVTFPTQTATPCSLRRVAWSCHPYMKASACRCLRRWPGECPCVSSTAPAFEEVAADAALHVVPTDVAAWAAAVESAPAIESSPGSS